MDWKTVSKHFKRERLRLRLDQTEVATNGGVPQSAISKIENGTMVEVDTLLGGIHGLGLSTATFFAGVEGMQTAIVGDRTESSRTEDISVASKLPAASSSGGPAHNGHQLRGTAAASVGLVQRALYNAGQALINVASEIPLTSARSTRAVAKPSQRRSGRGKSRS